MCLFCASSVRIAIVGASAYRALVVGVVLGLF